MFNLSMKLLKYQNDFFKNKKKRKIWIASRQIGKSHTIAHMLVYKALISKKGLSLCISVNQESASEIIKKCSQVAEAVKILTDNKITYTATSDKILFSTGARILSLSSNPAGMRGWSAGLVCIDEAAYVEHMDQVINAIAPTLSRDKNAELILCTTPAGKNGPFYELYQTALSDRETWYVQHTTIWDAINEGLNDVDIEKLKTLLPDPSCFATEYECQFSDTVNSLIEESLLKKSETENIVFDGIFMGIDFGRTKDKTAISVIGKSSGNLYLIDLDILSNVEFSDQISRIKFLYDKYKPIKIYGDAGGLGKPLMEDLNKKVSVNFEPFTFTMQSKSDCYEYFRKVNLEGKFYINPVYFNDIKRDIKNIVCKITDSGKAIYQNYRSNGSHGDIITSLILALYAEKETEINSFYPTAVYRRSRL